MRNEIVFAFTACKNLPGEGTLIVPWIGKSEDEIGIVYENSYAVDFLGAATLKIENESDQAVLDVLFEKSKGMNVSCEDLFTPAMIATVQNLMEKAYKIGRQQAPPIPQIPVWFCVEVEAPGEEYEPRFYKRTFLPFLPREGDKLTLSVGPHFYDFVVGEEVCYSEEYGDGKYGIYEVFLKPVSYDDNYKEERVREMIADFRKLDSGWDG